MNIDSNQVKELSKIAGSDVVGIASADSFTKAPVGFRPIDKLPGCHSVIVLGCPFPQEALSENTLEYTAIRNKMVEKLDGLAKDVAKQIKKMGYETKAIGGLGGKWDNGRFYGNISLKHAAELAGLGVIARNYLLTHSQYGNLLWFSGVLTSAKLEPDSPATYTVCDDCNLCIEICPSKALDDESLFNQKECRKNSYKNN